MKRHFDEDLDDLRGRLLAMGAHCEEMIRFAVRIIEERDHDLLPEIRSREDKVNGFHIEIDELALRLIALHQPAAGDLRLIAAALKINSDLERVGDQAVNIAETGTFLIEQPKMKLGDIPRMAKLAAEMLKDSLDAFARRDTALAESVISRDDEEDRLKSETFNELLTLMQSDASKIQRALDCILISRNLERIADHATNIAEDVIFMVRGEDVRHAADRTA